MPAPEQPLQMQIQSIEHAMKQAGVWSEEVPEWVSRYSNGAIPNIWEWLQYIYLPLRSNGTLQKPHYLALILGPYMNSAPEYKHILQLVIELDSLSPTIQKQ